MSWCDSPFDAIHDVSVGARCVGPDEPAYVVAEAGVNHNGDVRTALKLVDIAADCGADAVKFQMFRASELATSEAPLAGYQQQHGRPGSQSACEKVDALPSRDREGAVDAAGTGPLPYGRGSERTFRTPSQLEMLSKLELSQDEFHRIRAHCRHRSIDFLATPFSRSDLSRLVQLDPVAIKIASPDLTNTLLLVAAAETGLPVILSTGASTEEEIRSGVADLQGAGAQRRLMLLHCVSCYPTPMEAINLRAISTLARVFAVPCGLSDHTVSTEIGGWAVAAGACLLEKHFTFDSSATGPDHAMSLTPAQLADYVAAVRNADRAMGTGALALNELETEVRTVARKSVVSAVPLAAGTTLTADMLTLKRPGTGIPPAQLEAIVGRRTRVAVPRDTTLSLDMLQ